MLWPTPAWQLLQDARHLGRLQAGWCVPQPTAWPGGSRHRHHPLHAPASRPGILNDLLSVVQSTRCGSGAWAGSLSAFALQHMICASLTSLSSCSQLETEALPCHLPACFLRLTASCCLQCHSNPFSVLPTCTAWSMTFRTTLGAMTLAAAIWPRASRFPTLSRA